LVTLEKLDASGGLGSRVVGTFPKLGWTGSRRGVTLEKLDVSGGLGLWVVGTFPKLRWPGSRRW